METGMISVDKWTEDSQAYFLTHLHSDHTQGLTSQWSRGPLFCSRITAKLFPFKFPGFNLSLLRVVDIGFWHSMSIISPSTGCQTVVKFMAIDAHHCPGALMFLFHGDFGCLLYTGDFRWEMASERANKGRTMLLKALNEISVDILYLDNTYCNPSYVFPSRENAAKQIVDIITSYPEHDIIIGIDTLGKEDLLLHISSMLKMKIWVWPQRLQTMHLLGFQDQFTTKTALTRVRAVPRYSFSIDTLEGLNTFRPTIGIMPSGLPWMVRSHEGDDILSGSLLTAHYSERKTDSIWSGNQDEKLKFADRLHEYIFVVPYSDHSCFSELQDFVKLVSPAKIKGIVSSSSCYVDPIYYFGRLCRVKQTGLYQKFIRNEKGEETVEIDLGTSYRKRVKRRKPGILGVRINRVSTLRRLQRGANIDKSDCSD